MHGTTRALSTALLALTLCSCGGRATSGSDGAATDGKVTGKDGQGGSDSALAGICPKTLPASSTTCKREGLICQYGADPRRHCRPQAACAGGAWQITAPKCAPLPGVTCPATREAAAGKGCPTKDAYCAYPGDLICHCTNCIEYPVSSCGGPLTWRCDVPHQDPGCPPGKPNPGVTCAAEGKRCVYACGADGARVCSGGVWTPAAGSPCPISTRRAKREIAHLTPKEARAISRRLLEVKLATYRYRDPGLGRGRQLGFILEEVGPSYAGDPAQGRVNLYGYASMLLATVQTQQRSIDLLRREVRVLRASVRRCK